MLVNIINKANEKNGQKARQQAMESSNCRHRQVMQLILQYIFEVTAQI